MRKVGQGDAVAQRFASAWSSQARVTAVGRPAATSWAKVGPGQHRDRRRRADFARRRRGAARRCAPRCPWSRGSAACSGTAAPLEHRAHVLGRGHHQPGVAVRRGRRDSPVARIAGVELLTRADRAGFRGMRLTAATTSSSSAHSKVSRPPAGGDLRQRGAPGAAADHREPLDAHAFTPAPRTFSALRRAASAPAPERRARRSGRPPAARPRPRRSSPHCRCTARPAGR